MRDPRPAAAIPATIAVAQDRLPIPTVPVYVQTARTEAYALSRLTSVDYGDAVTQTYAFDSMDNRTLKTENGAQEASTYDAANRLLTRGGQPYTSDADGNTLTGGGRTNTWDSQNRLVQCVAGGVTSSYVYGADGLRRQSNVNGTVTRYVLDNSMQVRETDGMGVSLATYLIGPRGPEYRRSDPAGTIRWYCMDGLGSVLAEVDPTGALTATRKYDVYGGVRASAGSSTSKHRFVGSLGHASEDETGLLYMRARWMDPAVGRFISEGPARDGANWFEYCRGYPVGAVDRDGKRPLTPDERSHYYMSLLLAYHSFAWACLAAIQPGPAGVVFLMAAVSSFLAAAWQSRLALGLNDGRGLMFGGAVGGFVAALSAPIASALISLGRLSMLETAGVTVGAATVSYMAGVVAALYACVHLK